VTQLANTMMDEMQATGSYDDLHGATPDPFIKWDPANVPLGDINPIIALLGVARYLKITLDFAFCASMHFCWSFILADRAPMQLPFQPMNQNMFQVLMGGNHTVFQVPMLNYRTGRTLHTHTLAEIGDEKQRVGSCVIFVGCGRLVLHPMYWARKSSIPMTSVGVSLGLVLEMEGCRPAHCAWIANSS
jgi:hypothetical protein